MSQDLQLAFLEDELNRPKTYTKKLQPMDRKVISFCEQYYFLNRGQFPTFEQIAFNCQISLTRAKYILQNNRVTEAFERRGITNWDTRTDQTFLSPTQVACAVSIANFADPRSVNAKLEELGVNPSQYYAWLNQPAYKDFVRGLADQSLENSHHEAVASFLQLVRQGDLSAIKYYFDITGYADSSDAINLKMTVQRLIESVQRHVKDPAVLAAIALEIQGHAPVASETTIRLEVEA